jgi:hypothetical protein
MNVCELSRLVHRTIFLLAAYQYRGQDVRFMTETKLPWLLQSPA